MAADRRVLLALAKHASNMAKLFVRIGVIAGVIAAILQLFPTGDAQGGMLAQLPAGHAGGHGRPVRHAGGRARSPSSASPTCRSGAWTIRSSSRDALSFLTYRRWTAEVKGLDEFPAADWPDNIPLLYYSYHIMVGLGTIFIAIMLLAALLLWRGTLYSIRGDAVGADALRCRSRTSPIPRDG